MNILPLIVFVLLGAATSLDALRANNSNSQRSANHSRKSSSKKSKTTTPAPYPPDYNLASPSPPQQDYYAYHQQTQPQPQPPSYYPYYNYPSSYYDYNASAPVASYNYSASYPYAAYPYYNYNYTYPYAYNYSSYPYNYYGYQQPTYQQAPAQSYDATDYYNQGANQAVSQPSSDNAPAEYQVRTDTPYKSVSEAPNPYQLITLNLETDDAGGYRIRDDNQYASAGDKSKKGSKQAKKKPPDDGPVFVGGLMDINDFAKYGSIQDLLSGQLKLEASINPNPGQEHVISFMPTYNTDKGEAQGARPQHSRPAGPSADEYEEEQPETEPEEAEEDEDEEAKRARKKKKKRKNNADEESESPSPPPYPYYDYYKHMYLQQEQPTTTTAKPPTGKKKTKPDTGAEKVFNVNLPSELFKGDLLEDFGNMKRFSFGTMAKGLVKRAIKSMVYRVFPTVKSLKGVASKGCMDVQSIGSLDSILMPLGIAVTMHPLLMPLVPFLLLTLGTIKAIESATCFVSEFF